MIGIGAGDAFMEIEELKKNHPIPYPVVADPEFKAHKAVGEPRVPFIVVARKDKQNQWIVATVNVGLIFSAEPFIGELKAILHIDPEILKLKNSPNEEVFPSPSFLFLFLTLSKIRHKIVYIHMVTGR